MHKRISKFLQKQYTVTIAMADQIQPWVFACYYSFDEEEFRIIYVTGEQTKHAKLMKLNPKVSGTIFTPTKFHASLQGIQFLGSAKQLSGEAKDIARKIYKRDYHSRLIDELSVWEVRFDYIRLVDSSFGKFGKIEWNRNQPLQSNIIEGTL